MLLLLRQLRVAIGFALSALAALAVSIPLVGWTASRTYVDSLLSFTHQGGIGFAGFLYPIDTRFMPNVHGLIFALGESRLRPFLILLLTVISSILLILTVTASDWKPKRNAGDAFSLSITTAVLISYYLYVHDLTVMLIPLLLTLDHLAGNSSSRVQQRFQGWTTVLVFITPAFDPFLPNHRYLLALPIFCYWIILVIASRSSTALSERGFACSAAL